jgi:hypothetical protein
MCKAERPVARGIEEAHHIIARAARKVAKARQILIDLGVDINEAANGVALAKDVHRGIHTNAYYEAVNLLAKGWRTASEAREGLRAIAEAIAKGTVLP